MWVVACGGGGELTQRLGKILRRIHKQVKRSKEKRKEKFFWWRRLRRDGHLTSLSLMPLVKIRMKNKNK